MTFTASGFDNRERKRGGGVHFRIEASGRHLVYCYIRKNACSAFKQLILDGTGARGPAIYEILRSHHAEFPADFERADHTIFVYRDPLARAASVYKNKFIMRSGAGDILANYRKMTDADPERASFRDFVFTYLGPSLEGRDPHVQPQFDHLRPWLYSDPIEIGALAGRMAEILGPELGSRFFGHKENASARADEMDGAADLGSAELHQIYQERSILPSSRSLLTEEVSAELTRIYAADLIFRKPRQETAR